jgi:hypothetical protein
MVNGTRDEGKGRHTGGRALQGNANVRRGGCGSTDPPVEPEDDGIDEPEDDGIDEPEDDGVGRQHHRCWSLGLSVDLRGVR